MIRTLLAGAFALLLAGCGAPPVNRDANFPFGPLAIVAPERYSGLWYEIAHFPEGGRLCYATTAEYLIRSDGLIELVGTCREGSLSGEERVTVGVARVVDPETNAKLKVRYRLPFERDYWVLDRAEDYAWALVGEPSGRHLWVYAREPRISDSLKQELLQRLQARGYRTEALHWTAQDETQGRARRTFAAEPDARENE